MGTESYEHLSDEFSPSSEGNLKWFSSQNLGYMGVVLGLDTSRYISKRLTICSSP